MQECHPTPYLGITPTSGFNVVAVTVSPHIDTAPDIGTFNYQPVADTRAPHVLAYPARATHAKLATFTYQTPTVAARPQTQSAFRAAQHPLSSGLDLGYRRFRWASVQERHQRRLKTD